jgi:hypothetical protein
MIDGTILGQPRGVDVTPSDGYGRRQVMAILSGLLLATFVASLDQTVVAAALYRIGESLGGLTAQAWVTTAFLITSTIAVPVFGKLSDTHGRKRLFVAAIALFLAGSVLCAFAGSMLMLAAFRAFQGIGAGGILTLTSGPQRDRRAPLSRRRFHRARRPRRPHDGPGAPPARLAARRPPARGRLRLLTVFLRGSHDRHSARPSGLGGG